MGVEVTVDAALCVRTHHDTSNPRTISKLRVLISRPALRSVTLPLILQRGLEVIIPAAPVVPGKENCGFRPERACCQFVQSVHRPPHPGCHRCFTCIGAKGWVLVQSTRGKEPGNTWEFSVRDIGVELRPSNKARADGQSFDMTK